MPMRVSAPGEVPSSFAPDVTQGETPISPASSPWVSPMRNSAPGLLQQTGQTLTQAGDTEARLGNTIGDRVQETMDDALTKSAETQFLSKALPMLGQYKATEGINATQQFDTASQAIVKARQDARASLTNPVQQRMFDQTTNDHLLTIGQQMADHENVQRVQYGKDQAKARAASLNTMSTLDVSGRNRENSNFAKFGAQSDSEVLHFAGLSGIAADSPQAEQMIRENRTDRYRSVVTALLDQHAYNEASDFFDAHKDEMDMKQAEVLGNAVKSASVAVQGTDLGNQAIQSLQKTKGAGPLTAPIPAGTISTTPGVDGIDIHAAAGTNVHAPASGTVTKVWTDEEHGLSAEVKLPSGYTATFSGLAAVNYKEGQKITGGQVLGLSGQDDNGRAVTHYSMADPDGTFVDPRQAASAPFDPQNFSTPEDEAKAVSQINATVDDDVVRRVAVNRVESLANHNREIESQQHSDAVKQAMNYAVEHGGSISGLSPQVTALLTPSDIDEFSQQAKAKNDVSLQANWILHPEQMTVNAVTLAHQQGRLSDNGYLRALGQAQEMADDANSPKPDRVLSAKVDNGQFENTLIQNGRQDLVNARAVEYVADAKGNPVNLKGKALTAPQQTANQSVAQRVALQQEVEDQINAEQLVAKRALTRDQKQAIIDRTLLNSQFLKAPGWTGGIAPWQLTPATAGAAQYTSSQGRTVPYAQMPSTARPAAIQSLIRRRQPITEQSIYDTWVNSGMVGAKR